MRKFVAIIKSKKKAGLLNKYESSYSCYIKQILEKKSIFTKDEATMIDNLCHKYRKQVIEAFFTIR